MEWKQLIEAEIKKGFSKSAIENLAGLSKNNLASALSGKRELSKVSVIKIERWLQSEKPDPLTLIVPKKKSTTLKDLNKPTNSIEQNEPLGSKKSNYTIDTKNGNEGEKDNSDILSKISAIKSEKIPKERDTPNGRKVWNIDQYKRIKELESKLKH